MRIILMELKKPQPYKKIEGLEHIDKVIDIDQSPIGRTPRSIQPLIPKFLLK
jgi:excinuclease UvrABC ATPase subunit